MPNERRAVTRLDPAVRRNQILEAAARVFEQRDPGEVPFEEIADAAGVSRALVYNYFGDRGGLLAAVYLHHFGALDRALTLAADSTAAPADRFRAIVHRYLEFAAEHPGAWRLLQLTRAIDHPSVRESRQRRMARMAASWGGTTEAGVVAHAVVGMLEAATVEWLHAGEGDAEPLADVLFDLLWGGMSSLAQHGINVPPTRPDSPVRR